MQVVQMVGGILELVRREVPEGITHTNLTLTILVSRFRARGGFFLPILFFDLNYFFCQHFIF